MPYLLNNVMFQRGFEEEKNHQPQFFDDLERKKTLHKTMHLTEEMNKGRCKKNEFIWDFVPNYG